MPSVIENHEPSMPQSDESAEMKPVGGDVESTTTNGTKEEDGAPVDLLGNGKVLKEVLREGEGDLPPFGHDVTVHYTGTLTNGTKFDSSRDRESPFTFKLGAGEVIKGWEVGVKSMKKGERCKFTLHPDFAYGAHGAPPTIPPDATLQFDVELLNFAPGKKDKNSMTTNERIEAAQSGKEAGNQKFASGKYKEAVYEYTEALGYLDTSEDWSTELSEQARKIKIGCDLNLSNCYLKLQSWLEATLSATAALQEDPANVKALYRRGLARLELEDATESRRDFFKAAQLDAKNVEIRKALERAKEMEQLQSKKDSSTYAKMFQ